MEVTRESLGSAETTGFAPTFYDWFAEGLLLGPNQLPALKARASAENPALTNPQIGIGTISATPDAQACRNITTRGPRTAPTRSRFTSTAT